MAEFVLGCVQLGIAYGVANRTGKPSAESAIALLSRAFAEGLWCFDVARAYGDAEDRVGAALSGTPATIVTKLSPLTGADTVAVALAGTEASIAESLRALRRERLDVLLLHRAIHRTAFDGILWRRLLELQQAGTIGRLGISAQTPDEVIAALDDPAVVHIQFPYNVLDWRWQNAFEALALRPDVTVHVRSVFLQGLLAADDAQLWPAVPGVDAASLVQALTALANDLERESVADLCLAYVRGHHQIHGAVIGLETIAQLDANFALFAKPALTPAQCATVRARLPQVPEQLLNPALWPRG